MPKCVINGKEIDVPGGTTVIQAADRLGIEIPHFCWHPDLQVDGNCRMCLVEVEKMPKLQIACNTVVTEGMVAHTATPKAVQAQQTTLEFLLINHPIDCPVCDQAGECYLQDYYMTNGLHQSKVQIEEKVHKRKVVDLGPIMLDAERCVLCSRCIRFEKEVTGTNSFEFRNRGDHTEIATFEDRPITHDYAGNLADVCPVGALLSRDFRFKMRVWFLSATPSICPGCSTGCNIDVESRDGEVHRLSPRRNVEVNRSWMCDYGRALFRDISSPSRLLGARFREGSTWTPVSLDVALDTLASRLKDAGPSVAFVASAQATNEDLFVFRTLAEARGGLLDFRVGSPEKNVRVREDKVLLRADKNPNTQGCLDQALGKTGIPEILNACTKGSIKVVLLQDAELLRRPEATALAHVPFVAVMASLDGPELERCHLALPAAMWAEVEGTFTNYQRRIQRIRKAVPAPARARPRWDLAASLLERLGHPFTPKSAREIFRLIGQSVPDYAAIDYRALGAGGRSLPFEEDALRS